MDRFHNKYGAMTQEAKNISYELEEAIKPILDKYKDDIEILVFMREAIPFLLTFVSEYILIYSFGLVKKDKDKNELW